MVRGRIAAGGSIACRLSCLPTTTFTVHLPPLNPSITQRRQSNALVGQRANSDKGGEKTVNLLVPKCRRVFNEFVMRAFALVCFLGLAGSFAALAAQETSALSI